MPPLHKSYWVYFRTNHPPGTLYSGVTNSPDRRVWQHKAGAPEGFTKRYGLKQLVYFEEYRDVRNAISRETELKGWVRRRKDELIESANPPWKDPAVGWHGHAELDASLRAE